MNMKKWLLYISEPLIQLATFTVKYFYVVACIQASAVIFIAKETTSYGIFTFVLFLVIAALCSVLFIALRHGIMQSITARAGYKNITPLDDCAIGEIEEIYNRLNFNLTAAMVISVTVFVILLVVNNTNFIAVAAIAFFMMFIELVAYTALKAAYGKYRHTVRNELFQCL